MSIVFMACENNNRLIISFYFYTLISIRVTVVRDDDDSSSIFAIMKLILSTTLMQIQTFDIRLKSIGTCRMLWMSQSCLFSINLSLYYFSKLYRSAKLNKNSYIFT
jgi:hypothetical protein